jgi:hypothetical protein
MGLRIGALTAALCIVGLGWTPAASAERPVGSFMATMVAPYEIYRLAEEAPDLEDDMECTPFSSGINGRYKSQCTLSKREGDDSLDAEGKAKVKAYNKNGKTKLKLKTKLKGEAFYDGRTYDATVIQKGKETVMTPVSPVFPVVLMDTGFKVCLERGGDEFCDKGPFPAQLTLATADGGWTLALDIDPPQLGKNENKLVGTALLSFADGMTHEYALSGKYDPADDRSKIEFEATTPAKGGKIVLKKARYDSVSMSMKGTLIYDLYGHSDKLKATFIEMAGPTAVP